MLRGGRSRSFDTMRTVFNAIIELSIGKLHAKDRN